MSNPTVYGNLSNQYPDSSLLTGQVDLKNSIQNLNTNLDSINNKTATFLGNQDQVLNIINQEKDRLNQKKQIIDNAYSSQIRSTQLNNSINKRYNAYLKILYVVAIVLVIAFLSSFIGKIFPVIPSFVLTVIYIGLFSFAIIYSITVYNEIKRHEKINYDRLDNGRINAQNGLDISNVDISGGIRDESGNFVVGNCAEVNPFTGNCIRLLETFSGNDNLSSLNSDEYTNYSKY